MAAVSTSVLQPTIPGGADPQAPRVPIREPVVGLGQGESDLSQGLRQLGTGLEQQQRLVQEQDNQLGVTRSMQAVGAIHEWAQGQLTDAMTSAQGADPSFTPTFAKNFDNYVSQLVDTEPNQAGKQAIQRSTIPIRTSMIDQAQRYQANQILTTKEQTAGTVSDQLSNVVAQDRTQYEAATAAYQNTLQGMGLPPTLAQKYSLQADVKLKTAAVQNWIANDPRGAYTALSTRLGVPNPVQPTLPAPAPNPSQLTITSGEAAPYDNVIDQAAAKYGVNPAALKAIASQESSRNPNAVNKSTNATGLFQFIPATAQAYGIDPTDPAQSADAAAKMFSENLQRFGGDESKAIEAHFAGPDTAQWGPKTAQYLKDVTARMPAAAPVQVAQADTGTSNDAQTFAYQPDAAPIDTKIPYIDGLPLEHVLQLRNEAHAQIQQGMSQARVALERDMQTVEAAAKVGATAADIPKERFYAAYDPATAEAKYAAMGQWQLFGTDVRTIQSMPQNDMEQYLQSINPTPPPGEAVPADFAVRSARFQALAQAAQHVIEQRQHDPMLMAGQSKMAELNPIDLSDPQKTVAELQNRQQASASLTGAWAPDVPPLTFKEAQAFGGIMRTAPVSQQLQILDSFKKGLTDPGTYMRAMQQIAPDAPEIGVAGALAGNGHNDAAELILDGAALLHPSKQSKATDGSGHAPDMPNEGELRSAFAEAVGNVFAGSKVGEHGSPADQAYQAFRYYYAGAAARDGVLVSFNKQPETDRVKAAVDGALGGIYDWNGQKVVKPYGMPDDIFKAVFANEFTNEMRRNGHTLGDADPVSIGGGMPSFPLDAYTPVSLGNNRYLLRAGTGFVPTAPDYRGRTSPMVIQLSDYAPTIGPDIAGVVDNIRGALTPPTGTTQQTPITEQVGQATP